MSTPIAVTVTNGKQALPVDQNLDANDVVSDIPYITFPPFPEPPQGVVITPFDKFKPAGIKIEANESPDYVELDGQRLPTVGLLVKHSLTESEQKKKKKPKTTVTAGGVVRRYIWFEEWELSEHLRRTTTPIDPSHSRVDRLHQASQDFKSSRSWPPLTSGVQQLWDAFRLYLGIIASIHPPMSRKRAQMMQQMAVATVSEEEDEDEEFLNPKPKEQKIAMLDDEEVRTMQEQEQMPKDEAAEEARLTRRENAREARDLRLDAFLNDPETNLKIFLSSYFRDKGFIWSEQRARDAPILVAFFLNFLLRNRVLPEPEHEKGLRKALAVAEQAKKELPATFVIGKALPDKFSTGCEELWGNMNEGLLWQDVNGGSSDKDEPDAKRRKVDETAQKQPQEREEDKALKEAVGEADIEVLGPDVVMSLENEVKKDTDAGDANVNGLDDNAWGDPGADASAGGWGEPNVTADNSWAMDSASTWDTTPKPNPLMSFLGPTLLPLTHTTGVVERSTRRIISVTPVGEKGKLKKKKGKTNVELLEDELSGRLAKMVLAPWPGWDEHERSEINKPLILPDSRGAVLTEEVNSAAIDVREASKLHNPLKDDITVLLDPGVADKIIVGMGLHATWVQIARQDLNSAKEIGLSNSTRGGKGGPGEVGKPTQFWYMEQLVAILPSYHTEA
ncbi:hypothetical protein AcV5_001261 [Taiwanofungus camphoratus]|nr:hypothetical protein AcV5_001261 [Antrodia cinnamomea]